MNWFDIIPKMSATLYNFATGFNVIFFSDLTQYVHQVDLIVAGMSATIVGAPLGLIVKTFYTILMSFGSISNLVFGAGLPLIIVLLMAKKLIPLI